MAMSTYLQDALLDHITGVAALTSPAGVYLQLHTGDPGAAGSANVATENSREAITFGSAASGVADSVGTPAATYTSVAATETYTHVTLWDSATPGGGNCLLVGSLSVSIPAVATTDVDISLVTATFT